MESSWFFLSKKNARRPNSSGSDSTTPEPTTTTTTTEPKFIPVTKWGKNTDLSKYHKEEGKTGRARQKAKKKMGPALSHLVGVPQSFKKKS
jgi:hypothetical protein